MAGRRPLPALRQREGVSGQIDAVQVAVLRLRAKQGYRFSVIAGTIFENTNKPLRDWFRVVHLMLASKKGISALQISASWVSALTRPHIPCATKSAPR